MFKNAIDPRKLEAFLEINELLNSRYFDLEGLFTQILESATDLTSGEASSLLLVQHETQRLEFVVALGAKGKEVKSFTVPKGLEPGMSRSGKICLRSFSSRFLAIAGFF